MKQFQGDQRFSGPNFQGVSASLGLHPTGRPQQAAPDLVRIQDLLPPLGKGHGAKGKVIRFHTQNPPGTVYVDRVERVLFRV